MTRKITFLTLMFFAFAKLQAQDYQISFAGTGESTIVETVLVQNLTQGTSLTLNGSDVLHLLAAITGIEQLTDSNVNSMRIYPNPMTENSNIEFEMSTSGSVTVDLFDITGKKVTTTQNKVQAGTQTFNVSGLNSGIYTVNIKSDNFVYSGKIISNGTAKGTATISYVNSIATFEKLHLKSTKTLVPMQYTTGDIILLKASSGNYSTVKTLVPTASSVETFNFVAATDFDGNNYATVTIGTQTWMVEDLKVTHYRNGEEIPNVTDNAAWTTLTNGAYCWYNNDIANKTPYGALYNWFTVADARNIAPTGWHVPTDAEYTILTDYLGGTSIAGGKMKETGTTHWSSPNTGATNESGFTALPSGSRNNSDGLFTYLENYGGWWSSTPNDASNSWYHYAGSLNANCYRRSWFNQLGLAIRLVKD